MATITRNDLISVVANLGVDGAIQAGWFDNMLTSGGGGGGSGDIVGPASSTNNALAVFSGTTGKLLKVGTLANIGAATSAQGALADTAVQPAALTTALSGKVDTSVYTPAIAAARKTSILIAASDETTALTAGTNKVTFRMPFAMTGVTVRASLTTAQTSGSILTVDVNESGATILSTKLTIDNTQKTSTTATAQAVVSDASLADDAEITIDIDQIGDGTAKGLKVYITGTV